MNENTPVTICGKTLEEWYQEGQANNSRPGQHVHPDVSADMSDEVIAQEFKAFVLSMSDRETVNAAHVVVGSVQQVNPLAALLAGIFGPDAAD